MPFDVASEEVFRKLRITGDGPEHILQIVNRVRRLDVTGHVDAGTAEATPERAHEIVQRHLSVRAIAQREIEADTERRAPRVIGDVGIREVRLVDRRRGIHERRQTAHLDRRSDLAGRARRDLLDRLVHRL